MRPRRSADDHGGASDRAPHRRLVGAAELPHRGVVPGQLPWPHPGPARQAEPPDFDRRRRVPIADIYVPPIIYENTYTERTVAPVPADPLTLSVRELADRLDRTVLNTG